MIEVQNVEVWARKATPGDLRAEDGRLRVYFVREVNGLLRWPGTESRYTDEQLHYCGWTKD